MRVKCSVSSLGPVLLSVVLQTDPMRYNMIPVNFQATVIILLVFRLPVKFLVSSTEWGSQSIRSHVCDQIVIRSFTFRFNAFSKEISKRNIFRCYCCCCANIQSLSMTWACDEQQNHRYMYIRIIKSAHILMKQTMYWYKFGRISITCSIFSAKYLTFA